MNDHDFSSAKTPSRLKSRPPSRRMPPAPSLPSLRLLPRRPLPRVLVPLPRPNPPRPARLWIPRPRKAPSTRTRGKFVRHGAFHQERERRKAVEKERDELRERFARGDERLRLLTEAMQRAPAPAAPAAPETPAEPPKKIDPNEDIFGAYAQLQQNWRRSARVRASRPRR